MLIKSRTASYEQLEADGLQAYCFEVLQGTRQAIFSRLGGVSQPPWQSLNFSCTVGDSDKNVKQNFARACAFLEIKVEQLARCHLVHGKNVIFVRSGQASLGYADAMITREKDVVLFMSYADCVPVLAYDPVQQIVGLGHAGWRGTMQGITIALLEAMQMNLHCNPQDIRIVFGPSIGSCCYQVGQDVLAAAQLNPLNFSPFFTVLKDRLYFDVVQANVHQAYQAGVKQIFTSNFCTACRTDEFFSHRAENQLTGRFGVFLGLSPREKSIKC